MKKDPMTTNATPRPWTKDGDDIWHFGTGYMNEQPPPVDPHLFTGITLNPGVRNSPIAHANLALIVEAVNAYDGLKAQLAAAGARAKRLEELILSVEKVKAGDFDEGDGYMASYSACPWCGGESKHAQDCVAFSADGVVRAALAAKEGE